MPPRSPGSAVPTNRCCSGALSLAELDTLLQRELGADATPALVRSITSGAIRLVAPTEADLAGRCELLETAREHRPRLADAALVAIAERLGVRRDRDLRPARRSRSSGRDTSARIRP